MYLGRFMPVPGQGRPSARPMGVPFGAGEGSDLLEEVMRRGPYRRVLSRLPRADRAEFDSFVRVAREAFQPRVWTFQIVLLAGGAAGAQALQVGLDNWYVLDSLTSQSTGAYVLQLTEVESGQQLFPQAAPNIAVIGNANVAGPWYLPIPWIVTGTLQLQVTDTSGAANTINFSMGGYHIYPGRLPAPRE